LSNIFLTLFTPSGKKLYSVAYRKVFISRFAEAETLPPLNPDVAILEPQVTLARYHQVFERIKMKDSTVKCCEKYEMKDLLASRSKRLESGVKGGLVVQRREVGQRDGESTESNNKLKYFVEVA
jgi:hypothetical protein